MAKDQAIQNQKVFIGLADVVTVLNEYNRTREASGPMAYNMGKAANSLESYKDAQQRRLAIEWVLDTLQLPRAGK